MRLNHPNPSSVPPNNVRATAPRRDRRLKWFGIGILGLLALGIVILWLSTPVSYREYQLFLAGMRPIDLEHMANRVEAQCLAGVEATRTTGGATTVLELDRLEASVWLTQRAHQFLAGHELLLPKHIQDPMLERDGEHVVLRFRLITREMQPVVGLHVRPVSRPDGKLALHFGAVRAGRLPVPFRALTGVLHKQALYPDLQAAVMHLASWLDGRPFEAAVDPAQAGRVRITGLAFDHTGRRLRLTLQPIYNGVASTHAE